jgi:alpha-tubulin suppressor-like RCC1 family protein
MTRFMRIFAAGFLLAATFLPWASIAQAATPDVQAGAAHSLALKFDGTVYAWGSNAYGQLGNGTNIDSSNPVQVRNLSNVVAIAAGLYHNLAITSDGSVWAWGLNTSGQLGNNTAVSASLPVKVLVTSGTTTAPLGGAFAIAAGGSHSLIATNGGLMATGLNGSGQLGNGTNTSSMLAIPASLSGVTALAAGRNHSVALTTAGQVWTWGDSTFGQLGNGGTTASNVPVPVTLPGITQISSKDATTLALDSNSVVWCWGANDNAQCANGTVTSPVTSPIKPNVSLFVLGSVAAGGFQSMAIATDGQVLGWGDGTAGELSSIPPMTYVAATGLSTLTGALKLGAGLTHGLAYMPDGTVQAFGSNGSGQLGGGVSQQAVRQATVVGVGGDGFLNLLGLYNVGVTVAGSGTVTSSPAGLTCSGGTCVTSFNSGTALTLTATPSSGNIFQGWGGACTGTGICSFTIAGSQSVTASFSGAGGGGPVVGTIPDTGWWWNPAEPGRGYMIEQSNGKIFMAAFLYEFSGRASWYGSGPTGFGGGSYQGFLNLYAGGQTLTGSYHPATEVGGTFGSISINFTSTSTGFLTWPEGTIPIQRFDIVPNGSKATISSTTPQAGWWWNPAEPGRGFSLEIQNNTMLIAGYMYDTNGNPIWYSSQGTMAGPLTYQGNWVQYGNGQTLTGAFQSSSVVNSNVGALTIQFSSPTAGTMTLPDGRQIPFERFLF